MATWTDMTLITDDGGNYTLAVLSDSGSARYIHKDGSLHRRTDRRNECEIATTTTGCFKSAKKAAKAFRKALKQGNI